MSIFIFKKKSRSGNLTRMAENLDVQAVIVDLEDKSFFRARRILASDTILCFRKEKEEMVLLKTDPRVIKIVGILPKSDLSSETA